MGILRSPDFVTLSVGDACDAPNSCTSAVRQLAVEECPSVYRPSARARICIQCSALPLSGERILLVTRFFFIIPKLACLHCQAKFVCPQAGMMGVREL